MNMQTLYDGIVKDGDFLINLAERWKDENQYEDFKDYEKVIKERFSKERYGITITQVTKKPFGFKFSYLNQAIGISS